MFFFILKFLESNTVFSLLMFSTLYVKMYTESSGKCVSREFSTMITSILSITLANSTFTFFTFDCTFL